MARNRLRPRARTLTIGPDVHGRRAIVAGDRVCWFGDGIPPLTPGARRVPCAHGEIRPALWVEIPHRTGFEEGAAALGAADPCLIKAVDAVASGIVVTHVPDAFAAACARFHRSRGWRVVIVMAGDDGAEAAAARAAAIHGNCDPLVRFARHSRLGTVDEGDHSDGLDEDLGIPIVGIGDDPLQTAQRAFGRRFDLSEGAAGDVRVVGPESEESATVIVAGTVGGDRRLTERGSTP